MVSNLKISMCEPFVSPSWGSDFVVFSATSGESIKEDDAKQYLDKASKYARKFEVYLVPERFVVLGADSLCLIGPDGSVITAQQEIFTSSQTEINSSNLHLAKLDEGRIMLCVNNDIFHPELVRIGTNHGVNLIVSSFYISYNENTNNKIISGPWNASQNNNIYTVAATNTANSICGPMALTRNQEGFVLPPSRKSVVVNLNFNTLKGLPLRKFLSRSFYNNHRAEIIGPEFF